jgi:hypothetical protein
MTRKLETYVVAAGVAIARSALYYQTILLGGDVGLPIPSIQGFRMRGAYCMR